MRDITDGTSKTMIVGEYSHLTQLQRFREFGSTGDSDSTWDLGHWPDSANAYAPYSFSVKTIAHVPFSPAFWPSTGTFDGPLTGITQTVSQAALKSGHVTGIHVGMADGSCHFISSEIERDVFQDLADRADGNIITSW